MARKITTGEVGGATGGINITNTTISAASNLDISIDPQGTGRLNIQADTHLGLESDLRFGDADDSNYVGFKAPATITDDVIWTLPSADAAIAGYALTSNGSGTLLWQAVGPNHDDETTSATTFYPVITSQTTAGFLTSSRVSTTKISYQPSSGSFTLGGGTASTSRTTGTLIVDGGAGISGALYVGGDIYSYAASDSRLKENLSTIDNSLEKVSKISGYEYNWNSIAQEMHPERTMRDVGVVAQEVQEVLPSAVVEREDGYLAVDYVKIIPLLIESIKTLKEELDTIKRGAE
jgi:hypothetical protein